MGNTAKPLESEILHDIPEDWHRERKINQLLTIARMLKSRQYINQNLTPLDADDIYAIAACAIVKAVDDFDPTRKVKLTTYVMNKAQWAVAEAIREHSHTPRGMLQRGDKIRWVMFSQPAKNAGNVGEWLENTLPAQDQSTHDLVLAHWEREQLLHYIDRLPTVEKDALHAYITGDLKLKEVGQKMGLSGRKIYHIVERAIERMRRFHSVHTYYQEG